MAITAGGEGELAVDGLFTRILVSAMQGQADVNNDGFVTFGEMSLYTEQEVNKENSRQLPRYGALSGEGQMIFISSLTAPAIPDGQAMRASAADPPREAPSDMTVVGKAGIEWVYVSGGLFSFGSDEGEILGAVNRFKIGECLLSVGNDPFFDSDEALFEVANGSVNLPLILCASLYDRNVLFSGLVRGQTSAQLLTDFSAGAT